MSPIQTSNARQHASPTPSSKKLNVLLCTRFLRLRRRKRLQHSRIPHIRHFNITRIVRMHPISQIRRAKPRILIDQPDGRFRLIQTLRPRYNSSVEVLYFGIVAADSNGDDLRDLHHIIIGV
jgi:hypothetical protein